MIQHCTISADFKIHHSDLQSKLAFFHPNAKSPPSARCGVSFAGISAISFKLTPKVLMKVSPETTNCQSLTVSHQFWEPAPPRDTHVLAASHGNGSSQSRGDSES